MGVRVSVEDHWRGDLAGSGRGDSPHGNCLKSAIKSATITFGFALVGIRGRTRCVPPNRRPTISARPATTANHSSAHCRAANHSSTHSRAASHSATHSRAANHSSTHSRAANHSSTHSLTVRLRRPAPL
eukprot:1190126-Prorocentrum_minimum.AAC.14